MSDVNKEEHWWLYRKLGKRVVIGPYPSKAKASQAGNRLSEPGQVQLQVFHGTAHQADRLIADYLEEVKGAPRV